MNAPTKLEEQMPWSREEFEAKLRAKGDNYHINHPFNIRMNEGKLTPASACPHSSEC
jgi:pyrroloquinoline-quinone synthase